MDDGRSDRDTDWLSFGGEAVPLRNGTAQVTEQEQSERLRLIHNAPGPQPSLRIALFGALSHRRACSREHEPR